MKNHVNDLVSVGSVTACATAVSLSEVETGLRIISLLLAIAYTAYKFHRALEDE